MQKLSTSSNEAKVQNEMCPEFSHLPDSDMYIRKLESRLTKVKGLDKNLTSKGMISVLQQARDDTMGRLISSSAEQLSFADGDKEVAISYVEKKLFPEKNGVTFEELQLLLECDVLEKISAESNAEITDISVDR